MLYVPYSKKATERWPTDTWQNLKSPRAVEIGGESSDQILTVRNLGGAETLCRRSEKAAPILPQPGGGFFCVFVKDVKFAPSGSNRDFDRVHCAMMRHVLGPVDGHSAIWGQVKGGNNETRGRDQWSLRNKCA